MAQIIEKLPAAAHIGTVTLAVADVNRSIRFYTEIIGLKVLQHTAEQQATLGAGKEPLLILREQVGARRQPSRTTGLYHVAILVPTRPDLGRVLLNFAQHAYRLQGVADHLVSEAIYLADPDGNGLEIYRDRPRDAWHWADDRVVMATDPLDIDEIIASVPDPDVPFQGMSADTRIGHIHLRVGDIPQARAFYIDVLGFDLIAEMPSALFVSAGKYHHHIGMNIWQSAGAPPPPADSVGLREFVITLPDAASVNALAERLSAHHVAFSSAEDAMMFDDPWNNRIRVEVEALA